MEGFHCMFFIAKDFNGRTEMFKEHATGCFQHNTLVLSVDLLNIKRKLSNLDRFNSN